MMGNEFIVNNSSFDSLEEAYEKQKDKVVKIVDCKDETCLPEEVVDEELDSEEAEDSYSEEEEEEDEEEDDSPIIRAKWSMDGASTLDEAIEKLNEFIEYLRSLKADGWELRDTIDDDYGFLKKVN